MAQKNNIRSIRISDDMAELIDRQAGANFTEKWENLVTRCVWELPQKEEQLQSIQQQIENERKKLQDLRRSVQQYNQRIQRITSNITTLDTMLAREIENSVM